MIVQLMWEPRAGNLIKKFFDTKHEATLRFKTNLKRISIKIRGKFTCSISRKVKQRQKHDDFDIKTNKSYNTKDQPSSFGCVSIKNKWDCLND